jgi:hypothetical protein
MDTGTSRTISINLTSDLYTYIESVLFCIANAELCLINFLINLSFLINFYFLINFLINLSYIFHELCHGVLCHWSRYFIVFGRVTCHIWLKLTQLYCLWSRYLSHLAQACPVNVAIYFAY